MAQKHKARNKALIQQARQISFTQHAWDDYQYWRSTQLSMCDAVDALIKDCLRDPFKGIGKPEPLKGDFSGFWSRRIDREHRFVYCVDDRRITVIQCRYHYE